MIQNRSDIQQTILRTVAYFASFSYPLTAFEVWKWQKEPPRVFSFFEIASTLENLSWTQGKIVQSGAWYAWQGGDLPNAQAQAEERSARYVHAFQKERRLRWVLRWLRHVSFVEGIAVCNTLALHAARPESDIDLFVITAPRRVWSVRFWTILPLRLFRLRPGEAKRDPVDTNFFVSSDALEVSSLLLPQDDPYFLYWAANLSPVLDRSGIFKRFWAENPWIAQTLPCAEVCTRASQMVSRPGRVFPGLSFLAESIARRIQEWKFPEDTRALLQKDTRVVATDTVLKFHKNDRRLAVREAYQKRLMSV